MKNKIDVDCFDDWLFNELWVIWKLKEKIKDGWYYTIHIFQKVTRPHHMSDRNLWNFYYSMARIILPKLKAFRDYPLNGYPIGFQTKEDALNCCGLTEESYSKYVEDGSYIKDSKGYETWLEYIDEMIFAFEFILYADDTNSKGDPSTKCMLFYKRWGIESPYDELEKNKFTMFGETYYFNHETTMKYWERAQKGFTLFGKHYLSLND